MTRLITQYLLTVHSYLTRKNLSNYCKSQLVRTVFLVFVYAVLVKDNFIFQKYFYSLIFFISIVAKR